MQPDIAAKIAVFFEQYELRTYRKGHILIYSGENPEAISYIVSGKVKQYDLSYRSDEIILNVFKPLAFFPMSYALNRTPNEYFYEADSDLTLRQAPFDATCEFLRNNPDVLYDLLARVYRGTDGLLRRMAELMTGSAASRVMNELIIECLRFGDKQSERYLIDLNESEIASRAGLSRESVSREIQKLKNTGVVTIEDNRIAVSALHLTAAALGKEL